WVWVGVVTPILPKVVEEKEPSLCAKDTLAHKSATSKSASEVPGEIPSPALRVSMGSCAFPVDIALMVRLPGLLLQAELGRPGPDDLAEPLGGVAGGAGAALVVLGVAVDVLGQDRAGQGLPAA